jgi:hypothetical protein
MSDLAKDEEASLLQFLEGRARGGPEVATTAATTGALLIKEEKQSGGLRRSSEPARSSLASVLRAAAAAGSDEEGEAEEAEEEKAEWDQFRVHPLDRGKAKRDSNRAVGGASHSTTPSADNRQALIDQSIKQHRQVQSSTRPLESPAVLRKLTLWLCVRNGQLFFGVPEEKQEGSFLTLAAISYFFAESEDEGAASVRGKGSNDRWQAVAGDSDEDSDNGGMRLRRRDSSGIKRNRRSGDGRDSNGGGTDSSVGARKRSFSDASANDQAATAKTGRRSRSGAPAARDDADKQKKDKGQEKEKKKKKDKSKRHKSGKTWALDDLPELPGLEYISSNVYKYVPSWLKWAAYFDQSL